jgi:DNA-binding response OmpR family regulator
VLVVDDEADIRVMVRHLLLKAGYDVAEASSGREAVRIFHERRPDLVVLDVAMPELDGWATLERIRDVSDAPVLMLTARAGDADKVRGLRSGADDYLTKPFAREELLARVEALLRRAPQASLLERYADGVVEVDFANRSVTVAGSELRLTPREFQLLAAFVKHPNQVLSTAQLLELVWSDPHALSDDQVKTYVSYLRKKFEATGASAPIETVRGFGYRYRAPARA